MCVNDTINKVVVEQKNPDEHVWITIECEGRPTVSIDIGNGHGRRYMSTRLDGMTHHSMLLDTAHLKPRTGDDWMNHRFCPFCGDEVLMVSSRPHVCPAEMPPEESEELAKIKRKIFIDATAWYEHAKTNPNIRSEFSGRLRDQHLLRPPQK